MKENLKYSDHLAFSSYFVKYDMFQDGLLFRSRHNYFITNRMQLLSITLILVWNSIMEVPDGDS